jgi:hypothetical protein
MVREEDNIAVVVGEGPRRNILPVIVGLITSAGAWPDVYSFPSRAEGYVCISGGAW